MNFASMDMLAFGKVIMLGLRKFKQAAFPIEVLDFWLKLTIVLDFWLKLTIIS